MNELHVRRKFLIFNSFHSSVKRMKICIFQFSHWWEWIRCKIQSNFNLVFDFFSRFRNTSVMLSMELQPAVHIQHINHHGIVGSNGLTSLGSPSGQNHSGLLHHQQQQQSYHQQHLSMHDDKSQKSRFILWFFLFSFFFYPVQSENYSLLSFNFIILRQLTSKSHILFFLHLFQIEQYV